MPVPPIGHQLRWNTRQGHLYWTDESGDEQTSSWADATGSKVWAVSDRLHFTDWRNQIRFVAKMDIDPYVTFLEDQNFQITQPTPIQNVNEPSGGAASWLARYSVDITSPVGDTYRIEDQITWSSPAGKRLIINAALGERGSEIYTDVKEPQSVVFPELLMPGYRYASPQEALERAVAADLAHSHISMLNDLIAQGIVDENGAPIDNASDAARWAFAHGVLEVSPFTGAVFSYSGRYM